MPKQFPGRKCLLCSHSACKRAFLYVVADDRSGLVKIGCTADPIRRRAQYRANGNNFFSIVYKRSAGCTFTAEPKEERAIKRLDQSQRVRGDWFSVSEQEAIAAVNYVLK